uniref:Uncharacterized protein n=1 Tax=Arundo donax TaxID=35708 RepID=A0A0A9B1F0_ARUDO
MYYMASRSLIKLFAGTLTDIHVAIDILPTE